MAKIIMILFFLLTGLGSYYLTYSGIGQQEVITVEKQNIRSNSYRGGSGGGYIGSSSSSYNSSGYSYGK